MERKVGERFEYEGKTYMAVKADSKTSCESCVFGSQEQPHCRANDVCGACDGNTRADKTHVVFKKVIDVGPINDGFERKIGERFEYKINDKSIMLEVVKSPCQDDCATMENEQCDGCFFKGNLRCWDYNNSGGDCAFQTRADKTHVIFKDVTEEYKIKEAEKHKHEMYKNITNMTKQSEADVPFPEVEEKPYDITGLCCDEEIEAKIPISTYNELEGIGLLPNDVRAYNVGRSNYSQHIIQPWSIILDWGLDFFEGNILKYLLRTKKDTPREEDMDKIIHYAQEIKRQLKHKKEC